MIVLAISVSGILLFAKTRVQPPKSVVTVDQYSKNLSEFCSNISSNHTMIANDSIFAVFQHRIDFFFQEGLIDEAKANENLDKGRSRYVPMFLSFCFSKFQQSEWFHDEHEYMKSRINYLSGTNYYNGARLMTPEECDSATQILRIIAKYDQAVVVSRQTSFRGVESSKTTIQNANSYMNDEYLSNCQTLINDLSQVKSRLNDSHYNYVIHMIDKMAGFRYLSKDYYDNTLVPEIEEVIREYNNNASSIYGNKKNVDDLWNRARRHYDDASNYYEDE